MTKILPPILFDDQPVMSFRPDWTNGITETLTWLTSVLASSRSGANGTAAEQRRQTRLAPRRQYELDLILSGEQRQRFDLLIRIAGNSDFYVPLWHHVDILPVDLPIGSAYIPVQTKYSEYTPRFVGLDSAFHGGYVMLYESNDRCEVVSAGSCYQVTDTPDGLYILGDPNTNYWKRGITRVLPAFKMRLSEQPQYVRKSNDVWLVTCRFDQIDPADWASTGNEGFATCWDGNPVWADPPDYSNDLTGTFERFTQLLDNDTGQWTNTDTAGRGFGTVQHAWWAYGRLGHAQLRDRLYALQGRFKGIWFPSFQPDMTLAVAGHSADTTIDITDIGYAALGYPVEGRDTIGIFLRNGDQLYRHVVGAIRNGSNDTLALNAALGQDIAIKDVLYICFVQYSRFDQDAFEILHNTDSNGHSNISALVRNVSYDRSAAAWTPPTPLFPTKTDGDCTFVPAAYISFDSPEHDAQACNAAQAVGFNTETISYPGDSATYLYAGRTNDFNRNSRCFLKALEGGSGTDFIFNVATTTPMDVLGLEDWTLEFDTGAVVDIKSGTIVSEVTVQCIFENLYGSYQWEEGCNSPPTLVDGGDRFFMTTAAVLGDNYSGSTVNFQANGVFVINESFTPAPTSTDTDAGTATFSYHVKIVTHFSTATFDLILLDRGSGVTKTWTGKPWAWLTTAQNFIPLFGYQIVTSAPTYDPPEVSGAVANVVGPA